jgi:YgiT-type zinc finger domain-containing protein
MKNSLCAICGGQLSIKRITIDRMVEDRLYLFEKVPVQVCDQCGEVWIPGVEAERMDQAIQGKIKPCKQIVVPVY